MGQNQSNLNIKVGAVCTMRSFNDDSKVGCIKFVETNQGVIISGRIYMPDLLDGLHGFHIHQFGDDTNGCESMGPHFDDTVHPHDHGNLNQKNRHWGDLGNVLSIDGVINVNLLCKTITLKPGPRCIIGRGLVLHHDRDDLGKNPTKESKTTGTSGKRVACGPIVLTSDSSIASICNHSQLTFQ